MEDGAPEQHYKNGFAETASGVFRIMSPSDGAFGSPMDLVCRRTSTGLREFTYAVSLPNARHPAPAAAPIRHHGVEGGPARLRWGRAGPGVLDLALNVMVAYLPLRLDEASVRCADGTRISRLAQRYSAAFASEFLEPMPAPGGIIAERSIRAWLRFQDAMCVEACG